MGQEGVMGVGGKFSAEYNREAVTMLDAPGVTVSQITAELGIGAIMLGRWRREFWQVSRAGLCGPWAIPG